MEFYSANQILGRIPMDSYQPQPGTNCRIGRSLFMVFLLLFVIKAGMVLVIIPQLHKSFPDVYAKCHFPDRYDRIAMNLVNGNGYRIYPETAETCMRGPGYVLVLAGIFSLFGKSLVATQIVNILLAIATAYVTMRLSQKMMNRSVGTLVASLFFLFHPATILAETRGGVETLLTFLIVTFIFFLYRAIETTRHRDYVIAGSMLGLALLVKSTPILFPAFILPYLLCKYKKNSTKSIFTSFLVMLVGVCVIYSPWVFRNYLVSGKFVPMMTLKGAAAYQGLYLNKNIFSTKPCISLLIEAANEQNSLANEAGLRFKRGFFQYFYSTNDEITFDKLLFAKVMQEYKESPLLLMKCCLLNFLGFWFRGGGDTSTLLNTLLTVPVLILVIVGTYVGYKNKLNITPMLIFIGAYIILHLPLLGWARYHVPLIPFFSILASLILFRYGGRRTEDNIIPKHQSMI